MRDVLSHCDTARNALRNLAATWIPRSGHGPRYVVATERSLVSGERPSVTVTGRWRTRTVVAVFTVAAGWRDEVPVVLEIFGKAADSL